MSEGLGLGSAGFVERHGLYSDEQVEATAEVAARIEELGLRTVRLVLVDQHGVPRSKQLSGEGADRGDAERRRLLRRDLQPRHRQPRVPAGVRAGRRVRDRRVHGLPGRRDRARSDHVPGAAVGRPDGLDDLRRLLRERTTGAARRSRAAARPACAPAARRATDTWRVSRSSCYITRLARSGIRLDETGAGEPGPAPEVEVFQRGYQFLSDARLDGIGDTLEAIRDGLWDVGLPPRSIEDEWGPGQIEFTYGPMDGLAAADAMILFRSAVKAICQRRGLLASFMCWPALPNFFPCGWHLHQSLVDAESGANAFASDTDLLTPARAPVRRRPARLGPGDGGVRRPDRERVRAVPPLLVRARPGRMGGRQPGRTDPRPGRAGRSRHARREPPRRACREPVLLARREHRRGPRRHRARRRAAADRHGDPYAAEAALLPQSLGEAVEALAASGVYRPAFGDALVDYLVMMKRSEIEIHAQANDRSAWEMAEYFETF